MISVSEAAILLDGSPGWVRSLCQRNRIGDCFSTGKLRNTYHIVPGQLAEYMRISEAELERRLEEVRNRRH